MPVDTNPFRAIPPDRCLYCEQEVESEPIEHLEIAKVDRVLHHACYITLIDIILRREHNVRALFVKIQGVVMSILAKAWRVLAITFGAGIGLGLALACLYPLYKSIMASGEVTFCYIDTQRTQEGRPYGLKSHRDWRPDSEIGYYENLDSAMKAAERLNCKVK
jgi:hypothetical protein